MIINRFLLWHFLLVTSSVANHPLGFVFHPASFKSHSHSTKTWVQVHVTCVTTPFLRKSVLMNSNFKEQDGRFANPFLPFPNVYHLCLLLCKFGFLHLIHLCPYHPCSQQKHKDLPNYHQDFPFCLVSTS